MVYGAGDWATMCAGECKHTNTTDCTHQVGGGCVEEAELGLVGMVSKEVVDDKDSEIDTTPAVKAKSECGLVHTLGQQQERQEVLNRAVAGV